MGRHQFLGDAKTQDLTSVHSRRIKMSVYFGVFRKCYTFVLAMCVMHIGVNSNHHLIRLVCDRWGGFLSSFV